MGLSERENKRKQSIVGTIISDSPENSESKNVSQENITIVPKPKTETRSKRINLLITPSVYNKAQKKCEKIGISLNECINQFLENWTQT
jgi:predicted HicB family RNase H-like nuclease